MEKPVQKAFAEFQNILVLINDARNRAYSKANAELVLLYFNVGGIVSEKVKAGSWGEKTVDELADFIQNQQPGLKGFNRRGLYRMKQFYQVYSDEQFVSSIPSSLQLADNKNNTIVSTLLTQFHNISDQTIQFVSTVLTQIPWSSHLHILSKTKAAEEKLFYLLLSIKDKLSVRELERQLNTATFERTMLGNQVLSNISSQLPSGIFKDPYIFEFLSLPEGFSENDLQGSLVKNLKNFILEMGKGFTYMGNEYRLQIGNKDYYTDLLFYHRDLQCLVLFELKIEDFQPEFLGELNFYLEALDQDVKRPHEKPSIGILLCKGKDTEVVKYSLARSISPALIAEYETKLIDRKVLANKLHELSEQIVKKYE